VTTIAFDGRYLAADTLTVRGGNRVEQPLCKLAVRDGVAYAFGGMWWALTGELMSWYGACDSIVDFPNPRGLDGALLAVNAYSRQATLLTAEMPYPDLENPPVALGTGSDLALGAMGAGVTAMEAVQIAMRWDLKTGGHVEFVDLEFIDKGVQRWGCEPVVRDTSGTPLRDYVKFEVTGNGPTARRVPDLSEDGITEVLAEMRRKHPGERVRASMCVHGYIPSTCDTCRANRTANIYPV
jgi:hypothetical protein